MQVNKILLTRDRPEQFPSFFVRSFQWYQTTRAAFPNLIIFLNIQLIVWIACYFTVFMTLRIFSNFAIIMAGTNSFKRFLKKLLVQRNTKINKKRNGVVTLPCRLRLQKNPDHKKFSSIYITVVVIFFSYLNSWRCSYKCSNLGGIPPPKSSQALKKQILQLTCLC